jgi:hypothetical protein
MLLEGMLDNHRSRWNWWMRNALRPRSRCKGLSWRQGQLKVCVITGTYSIQWVVDDLTINDLANSFALTFGPVDIVARNVLPISL